MKEQLFKNLERYEIWLCSRSPRRKQLLEGLGIPFKVKDHIEVPEDYPEHLKNEEIAMYLADIKAKAFIPEMKDNTLIITADTIVCIKGHILGKPSDKNDAARMLTILSGNRHTVITGVCIMTKNKKFIFSESSEVYFNTLHEEEINYYIHHYSPFDKAGAYGIQEFIGYIGIKKINGSFFNVMGLPIHRVYEELKRI